MYCGTYPFLTGALANATRSKAPDIHFGLYFSQFEWFNPIYLQDKEGGFKTQDYVKVRTCHGDGDDTA